MKIKKARKVIRKAFKEDTEFKRTYVDNVAMHLYDTFVDVDDVSGKTDVIMSLKTDRDKLAEEIIDLIVGK